MATGIGVLDRTYNANVDLSAKIYCFVQKDVSGNGVILATDGGPVLGVLQNKPTLNQGAVVRILGETPVIAGANSCAEGDLVSSDASGNVDTAASGEYIAGIATKAGVFATGQMATVMLLPQGKK